MIDEQKIIIINLLKNKRRVSISEFNESLKRFYRRDHAYYIGEILQQMVKDGVIELFAIGVYRLCKENNISFENQQSLFK